MIHGKDVLLSVMTLGFPAGKFTFNICRWVWRGCLSICQGSETPTVKLSNNATRIAVKFGKVKSSQRGKGTSANTTLRWSDSSLPKVKTAFHHKSSQCPQCWKSVVPPQDGSTHVPQAQWCPAPGSCAAPTNTKSSTHTQMNTHAQTNQCGNVRCWVMQVHTCLPRSFYFPFDANFPTKMKQKIRCHLMSTIQLLCSEMSYLSHDVSVLSVHLGDGSQIPDHTEHLVHLQPRGRHSDDPWCTNATFVSPNTNLEFCSLLYVQNTAFLLQFWHVVYQWCTKVLYFQKSL